MSTKKAGTRHEYTEPFILDETKLRKICDVLKEHAG